MTATPDKPQGSGGKGRARPSGTGSREPSPSVSALTGFDPARWMDLYCALANARYALELWEREYSVAANRGQPIPATLAEWCIERGRRERETLSELEHLVRPLACRDGDRGEQ